MEHSSVAPTFVGIDVAKDRLDVHLRPANEALALGRDSVGLAALVERLVAPRPLPSAAAQALGELVARRRQLST